MKLWQYWFMRMYYRVFCGKAWRKSALPPTLRWFNTAGSLLLEANTLDPRFVGGVQPDQQKKIMESLADWWDITDHDSAIKEMTSLIERGMRASFDYKMRNGEGEKKMRQIWEKQGENALLGWDLCRAVYVSSWCFACRYISLEELMELGVAAGKKLQGHFGNWDEVMKSYLTGLWYWMEPDSAGEKRSYQLRVHLWKQLRKPGSGAYGVTAFFTPLTTQLTDAEKAQLGVTHL